MDLKTIDMPADEAERQAEEYAGLVDPTAEDQAVLAGLKALAGGRPVINVGDVLRAGGVDEETHRPRLALARADWEWVHTERSWNGRTYTGITFQPARWPHTRSERLHFSWPYDQSAISPNRRAMVPPIPPKHRPRRTALRRYMVLFEVDAWEEAPAPPGDPALLRRLVGDLCVVEHVWDLTELERAVLSARNQ